MAGMTHALPGRNQTVWEIVGLVPHGRVATYGQVAALAGFAGRAGARQVGYALAALPAGAAVPWQRIVNAAGRISRRADPDAARRQRLLLEAEGIEFGKRGEIDLDRHRWNPASAAAPADLGRRRRGRASRRP